MLDLTIHIHSNVAVTLYSLEMPLPCNGESCWDFLFPSCEVPRRVGASLLGTGLTLDSRVILNSFPSTGPASAIALYALVKGTKKIDDVYSHTKDDDTYM